MIVNIYIKMGASKSTNKREKPGKNEEEESRVNERRTDHVTKISLKTIIKVEKSICKISYEENNKPYSGTGFFMEYKNLKCIITNYHVISNI